MNSTQPLTLTTTLSPGFSSQESTLRVGAQPILNDAEVLTSGVSHDKAQRLSVQEWIASKARPSTAQSTPTPQAHGSVLSSTSLLLGQPQMPDAALEPASSNGPSLFSFLQQPAYVPQMDPTLRRTSERAPQDSHWPSTTGYHETTDDRYEDTDHRGAGVEYNDDFVHFDPFRDDPRHSENGGVGSGGKSKRNNSDGDGDKFHTRVTRWKSQKDAIREQLKQQLLQNELDECTFTPKVNPKSTKVVAKLRGREKSIGGGESDPTLDTGGNAFAVSERLYQEADIYKAREELAAKLKCEEEAELQRECTFKPKINKNNHLTEKVKPKYMEIPRKDVPVLTPAAMEAAAKELQECTFYPKVNPISQEMVSAQLYLQQNIYERLSRPCIVPSESVEGRRDDGNASSEYTEDMLSSPMRYGTQDDIGVRSRHRRGSTSMFQSGARSARPKSAGGIVTDEEKAERAKQFEEFLERQKFHEQARKKKIETTQQQLVAPHRPSINKKSLMMMENGRKGDFLERITKYAIRKEQDSVKSKTVLVSDPHCTFKPTINPHSAKRSGRSVTELSRGDLLRRETTQRLMKLKMEQEEMASLTFRPQLSRASQRAEGRLKILTSPDTYLERIQQQSQAHHIKQRRAIQEKEMEEFSECTFKPRTIEAPAYVQRIARSVSLTKALKKQEETRIKANQKPEWK